MADIALRQYPDSYYQLAKPWDSEEYAPILRKWVDVQLQYLNIQPTELMEDVAAIQFTTKKTLADSINFFTCWVYGLEVDMSKLQPFVLPNLVNVLDERDARVIKVPGFRGSLHRPQEALLYRMIEVEDYRNTFLPINEDATQYKIQSNLAIVNERASFGKTYIMPALLCARPIPRFQKLLAIVNMVKFYHEPVAAINIVVCTSKALKQWETNIQYNTELSYVKISTAGNLTSLQGACPDIILIKDGNITWRGASRPALTHFLNVYENKLFARLIVDDYDKLKFKHDQPMPRALFTWLLSSTSVDRKHSLVGHTYGYFFREGVAVTCKYVYTFSCNTDYSAIEFDVPQVDYYFSDTSFIECIKNIKRSNFFSKRPANEIYAKLLPAQKNVPYVRGMHKLKIMLVLGGTTEERENASMILNQAGIKAARLERRNIHLLESDDVEVAVCDLIYGVNLGGISHMIIPNVNTYRDSTLVQIIGRAQRTSRIHNLQVYFTAK